MRQLGTMDIATDRLVLRRFRLTDAEQAYENFGKDPLVGRYVSFTPFDTLANSHDAVRRHVWEYENNPDFYGWAVTLGGEVIGSIGLFDIDHDSETCELGYSIGSRWWGNGYGTEAAKAVVDFAILRLFAHRVQATHHPDNIASKRVLEKIGMKFEGIMRGAQRNPTGTYSDLWLYARLSDDRSLPRDRVYVLVLDAHDLGTVPGLRVILQKLPVEAHELRGPVKPAQELRGLVLLAQDVQCGHDRLGAVELHGAAPVYRI